MSSQHSIDFAALQRNSDGVYELPLSVLRALRFAELPPYDTFYISGAPEASDTYSVAFTVMRNEPTSKVIKLDIGVVFEVPRDTKDEEDSLTRACKRKRAHITRYFADTARNLGLAVEPDVVPYWTQETHLAGDVRFSRSFEQVESSVLVEVVERFSVRFNEFVKTKDLLLFICHASEDKPFVESLCRFLDGQGVPVWYDRREIKVGDSIVQRVEHGLESASHVIVVLSGVAVQKSWVRRELSSTLMRQLANASVQLLPVVAEDCSVPPLLADIKYADCRADRQRGFSEVLDAVL